MLKTLFVLFPLVSNVAFEAFPCYDVELGLGERGRWLIADVAIDCDAPAHDSVQTIAWIAVLVFPVGITLGTGALLFRARKAIVSESPTKLSTAIAFLHREYKTDFFFWEVCRACT